MKVYLYLISFSPIFCLSQNVSETYRIKYKSSDISGIDYHVDILKIFDDGSYKLIRQFYISRKYRRLNNAYFDDIETGKWSINNDVYELKNDKNNFISKFKIKRNKIFYMSRLDFVSNYAWRKID